MDVYERLFDCIGFDWDEGNRDKNWRRHRATDGESEQLFFNEPFVVATDDIHSRGERRYYALGQTDGGRRLFVVFTIRGELIRVISARDMTRRELRRYERE